MVNINDLRRGNYLRYPINPVEDSVAEWAIGEVRGILASGHIDFGRHGANAVPAKYCQAIEITDEVLINNLGFIPSKRKVQFTHPDLKCKILKGPSHYFMEGINYNLIVYVHELQNCNYWANREEVQMKIEKINPF